MVIFYLKRFWKCCVYGDGEVKHEVVCGLMVEKKIKVCLGVVWTSEQKKKIWLR